MKIKAYSERGIINALIYSMHTDEKLANEFINLLLPNYKIKDNSDITVYVEQSLSDFGDPDLIIKVDKSLIFIEAKVKTCSNTWKGLKKEFKKYDERHTSNLFRQLCLKHELVSKSSFAKTGIKIDDPKIQGSKKTARKIGNNNVVLNAFNEIKKNFDNTYYVALVPDSKEDILNFKEVNKKALADIGFEISFISWSEIEKQFKDTMLISKTFEYNKGQIF